VKKLVKFPKIAGFRDTVYSVNRHADFEGLNDEGEPILNPNNPRPVIDFTGTVKLHGTNAAVCWDGTELWAQSKERIITAESDNHGFAFFVDGRREILETAMRSLRDQFKIPNDCIIAMYGEWCGKGIQRGVAISQLEKMFVVFKIKIATPDESANYWLDYDYTDLSFVNICAIQDVQVRFIESFDTFKITIDFSDVAVAQDKLVALTNGVEVECPVGRALGVAGVGEGIVWTGSHDGQYYMFKVKGEKHSSSKVRKLAPVDVEKVNSIKEFVEYAVTENRLEQGFDELFTSKKIEASKKYIGEFLKWVQSDVVKEEADTMAQNGLEPKEVNKAISGKAVKWFMLKVGV